MHTPDPNEKLHEVILTPPDPCWITLFEEASRNIRHILGENTVAIHHIGSTAIPNIYAKPIIDVLIVVHDIACVDAHNPSFEALGYTCMGEYGIEGRRFYWKSKGTRTHHLHLFEQGSPEIERHLSFRDFLRKHKNYTEAYSVLKQTLAELFPNDIERYLDGKSPFVSTVLNRINFQDTSESPITITLATPKSLTQKQWVALLKRLGYAQSNPTHKDIWHFPEKPPSQNSLYRLHRVEQKQQKSL